MRVLNNESKTNMVRDCEWINNIQHVFADRSRWNINGSIINIKRV